MTKQLKGNRPIRVVGDICEIPLTRGKTAICDAKDYDLVSGVCWCAMKSDNIYYAVSSKVGKLNRYSMMHRYILGLTDSKIEIDHIDRDGLNNRRSNLRTCSRTENMRNRGITKNNTSGYKGVNWNKQNKKWCSRIKVNYKEIYLGNFDSKLEAAAAYNTAARKYFGRFAVLNEL